MNFWLRDILLVMEPFQWQELEYQNKERPQDWYWAIAVITVASSLGAVIFVNIIFALFILLAGGTLILFSLRDPDVITVNIDRRGVAVNDKLYPFNVFDSFWIEERENPSVIILKSEQVYSPLILIPIAEEIDPDEVREYLVEYLDEEEMLVPFSRKILEFLGF